MGPIAQKFFAPDGSWQTGCEDDGIAANKFAKMLKLTGAQITAHCTEAGRLTNELWPQIHAVAAALVEHKTLTAARVRKIMRAT